MAGLLYNPQNVVVGVAIGHYAPVGTAPPADTVLFGGDWGPEWVNPGATEEGWRLTAAATSTAHNIEEQPNPVLNTRESQTVGIAASLAEDTLESLRLSFGGGTITTVAGTGVKIYTLPDTMEEFAIGLDMKTHGGRTRRIILPRSSGSASVDVGFRRSASKRLWPIQFDMLNKPSELFVRDLPAVA